MVAAEPFVKIADVAQYLAVSSRTVVRWIDLLGLPCHKIGGALRFRMSEVNAWLAELDARVSSGEEESEGE